MTEAIHHREQDDREVLAKQCIRDERTDDGEEVRARDEPCDILASVRFVEECWGS